VHLSKAVKESIALAAVIKFLRVQQVGSVARVRIMAGSACSRVGLVDTIGGVAPG
jgi:hypothetical protein